MMEGYATARAAGLTVGSRRSDLGWVGVLRRGRKVLVECGHGHHNRDESTKANGTSARDCVSELIRAATFPPFKEEAAERILTAWQNLSRAGFVVPVSTIERVKAEGPVKVREYERVVAKVAAFLPSTPLPYTPTRML